MNQLPFDFILPSSNWVAPNEFPSLADARLIALDTETNDPQLKSKGAGWIYGAGHCAGVSIAADNGFSGYYPIGHGDGGNLDAGLVSDWLRRVCAVSGRDYIFANAFYDIGWLDTLGIKIGGRTRDISICDTLLNEEHIDGYGLEALGKRWLGSGKDEVELNEAARAYGFRPKQDLWRLHARFVGKYAETDAIRTLQIYQKQLPKLKEEKLLDALELETKLTPLLYRMTKQGIRVDLNYANELNETWLKEERSMLSLVGIGAKDIWDPECVRSLCRQYGIPIPPKDITIEGSGSLDKNYLNGTGNKQIIPFLRVRAINRCREIYLEQNLIRNSIKGRIHPQYIQMKSDEGGTRTMRLASKNPNAQQFPKRSRLFDSKLLRKCLIAEEGCQWAKIDYWSQEPIIQTHYALRKNLPGAEDLAAQFAKGIKLATFIEQKTNGSCNYDEAKGVAIGRSYGMGIPKMSHTLGIPEDECKIVLAAFDEAVPFIKILADLVSARANARGFLHGPLGYRRRFDLWNQRRTGVYAPPLPYAQACDKWGVRNIQRAYTYKAFNALCQMTGAIQAKKALVDIAESVVMPTLPVHDEINSANITSAKQAQDMKLAMENAIKLDLPVRADLDLGTTWQ